LVTLAKVLSAFLQGERQPAHGDPPTLDTDKKPTPAADVQAALTVLARLPKRPDWSRADLSSAQLAGARLNSADLSNTRLDAANLSGADLRGADLTRTVGLGQPQLDAARGNAGTRIPDGLQRPTS
jgi:hypothetical protein